MAARPAHLVDCHAHMSDPSFARDLAEVIERAEIRGVRAILAVAETLDDAERILGLAERFPIIKPCAGLYPTVLEEQAARSMVAFIRAHREHLVAIGEVGLDFWAVKNSVDREVQTRLFAEQIAVARELELPLNVHSRSAGRHTITMLRECGAERVVLHAFDGKASAALEGIEAGYFFSIPPSVVRSPQKQRLVRHLPLDRLLLESDAPVLGPSKEERNEPANIVVVAQAIADIKEMVVDDVAAATTENAHRAFPRLHEAIRGSGPTGIWKAE